MPSGTVTPSGGGGGSSPALFAYFGQTGNISIDAGGGYLGWNYAAAAPSHPGEAANPFNLAVPTNPVVIADGEYTIHYEYECDETHAGKSLSVLLAADLDGVDDGPGDFVSLEHGGSAVGARSTLVMTRQLSAGMKVGVFAYHDVGSAISLSQWALVSWRLT